jgi:rhodanese-related sulfurtransferase
MKDIASEELIHKINSGKFEGVIVDIRNENETKMGYYTEAILLPMNKIKTHGFKVLKPEETYYVHCAGGVRSQMAYGLLNKLGYNVTNIQKGFEGMVKSGLKQIMKKL